MRILELPSFFPPYGGEFCLDQANALQQLGHEVTILSVVQLSIKKSRGRFFTMPYGERRFKLRGVEVWQRFTRGIPKVIRPNVRHWTNTCVSLVEEYIKERGKPDIIHAHCGKWAGCVARIIKERHNVPYAVTEHLAMLDVEAELQLTGGKESWEIPLLKKAYKEAGLVMPVSCELAEQMKPFFGDDYRWQEQSNMIDTDYYTFCKRRIIQGNAPIRLLCLAHYSYRKGYDLLFEALKKVEDQEFFELHIAGRDTDSKTFRRFLDAYGLRSKVIIHGLLDKQQVRELLYHSDVLVLPTRAEVHPLVVLEAISSGIPAIITEACPKHTLPKGSFIPVTLDTIADGLLKARAFIKGYDAEKASRHIAEHLSMEAVGRSIEQNLKECL